jgi:hypothetical protein
MPPFSNYDVFGDMVAGRMKKVLGEMGRGEKGGVYGF